MLCNSTFESSVITWTTNHRMHHRFEETNPNLDPYSITNGFMWSHITTHFYDKNSDIYYDSNYSKILLELKGERSEFDNLILDFEDKYYTILILITGIILPTMLFQKYYKDELLTCFVSSTLVSIMVWHSTWSVNSFAHLIGDKPFNEEHTAVDNHLVSLIAFGEGYHNYHHTHPKDYKASEDLCCFNITGIIIYVLNKLNLTWDLIEL
tara:strand:+ start:770 stop:1396 length:627 start_codon:yes stop_codon:yes gene_type:complete